MRKPICFISVILTLIVGFSYSVAKDIQNDIPKFKISGRYQRFYSVIVPVHINEKQLINLIQEIRKARIENNLIKYFSPTTPNGKMGDFAIIGINIFSDPHMAKSESLRKYMEGSDRNPSDVKFAQHYAEKVLGHYYYSALSDQEFGCLGLRDPGIKQTAKYKKLFGKNIPY